MRCAPFHESQAADPIGSAGCYDGFLVVDVPLPWDREVTAAEPFRTMLDGPTSAALAADGSRWRPLARVPPTEAIAAGGSRITEHCAVIESVRLDDGTAVDLRGPYRWRQWIVSSDDVMTFARAMYGFGGPTGAAASAVADTAAIDASPIGAPSGGASDEQGRGPDCVLVCTHGRRDQCCGGPGTAMFEELAHVFAESGAAVDAQRISHTGGHRFAPTAITFPDGYAWAHLDATLVDRLVRRADPPARFAEHCRGSALFDGAAAQAADRAGLVVVGWEWAEVGRAIQLRAFDRLTMTTTVRAIARLADGSVRAFDVVSVPDRHIPSPTCGLVDGPEYTTEAVWRVLEVDEVEVGIVGAVEGPGWRESG